MYHVAGNDHVMVIWIEKRQAKSEDETLLGSVIKNTWNLVSPLLLAVKIAAFYVLSLHQSSFKRRNETLKAYSASSLTA